MDFFEAQARAKKRTSRLVVLFVFAVVGIVAAGYFATVIGLAYAEDHKGFDGDIEYAFASTSPLDFWQPDLLAKVALGTVVIVGGASFYKWRSLRHGGSAVAEMVGGQLVYPNSTDLKERQLLNIVEEMAIASGVPVPPVYLLEKEPGLNAFAAGLAPDDAVVAVTRGTLDKLTRDELQGVVAHEFSHILNGDMRLNLKLTSIVYGILVVALLGRSLIRMLFYARPRHSSREKKGGGGAVVVFFAVGLTLMIIGYVGYFFGRLIQAAVSRQREFLADASAVQFTRNPGGIVGALKKIGGYALGSRILDSHASEISHFFFAQSFRSSFAGVFATHPPLGERLRALDPSFDGKYFEPPQVVDVSRESFRTAGFAPPLVPHPAAPPPFAPAAALLPTPPPRRIPFRPGAAVRSIGQPSSTQVDHAQSLLESLPAGLRDAARSPDTASALLYGLLLSPEPSIHARQLELVAQHAGPAAVDALERLQPSLLHLADNARLPLLQLTPPALRQLDPAGLDTLTTTLDELVHADGHVSIFEYALQKVLLHHLRAAQAPLVNGQLIYSFEALTAEFNLVLSALARATATDEAEASNAFAAGVIELPMLANRLTLLSTEACGLVRLDAALDRLAKASGPIKQRLLIAAGNVIAADGQTQTVEVELLRAIATALDCPMPPIG